MIVKANISFGLGRLACVSGGLVVRTKNSKLQRAPCWTNAKEDWQEDQQVSPLRGYSTRPTWRLSFQIFVLTTKPPTT